MQGLRLSARRRDPGGNPADRKGQGHGTWENHRKTGGNMGKSRKTDWEMEVLPL